MTSQHETGSLPRHVYFHGMWRVGSTAVARAFLNSPRYLVFVEPFHEACGARPMIETVRREQADIARTLNHPAWAGGYFDAYLAQDPLTGKALCDLFDPSATVATVYRDAPSPKALDYLKACERVAEAQGKAAFFGFCRSGRQQAGIPGGRNRHSWYLARDPRSQFLSYNWPENPYFMAGTYLQLRQSPKTAGLVRKLLPLRAQYLAFALFRRRAQSLPHQLNYANRILSELSTKRVYQMFYLSYLASRAAASRAATEIVDCDAIIARREVFEDRLGVDFAHLKSTRREVDAPETFRSWEGDLIRMLGRRAPEFTAPS